MKLPLTLPLFFTQTESAIRAIGKHWILLALATFVELGFFYFMTIIHAETFLAVQQHLNTLLTAVQQSSSTLGATAQLEAVAELQNVLIQNPQVAAAYAEMLRLLGLFFVYVFAAVLVFQGASWFLAHKIAREKQIVSLQKSVSLQAYAWRFSTATIVWFAVLLVLVVVYVLLQNYALFSILPLVGSGTIEAGAWIALFLLSYVGVIAFAQQKPSWKQTWSLCIRGWKELVPAHMLMLVLVFAVMGLAFTFVSVHYWLSIAWIFLIALPSFTLARVYGICVVEKLVQKR